LTSNDDTRTLQAPPGTFRAARRVPGDKSLSHRALIFAAFARGTSEVAGLGPGRDVAATGRVLRELGVTIMGDRIFSAGIEGWVAPPEPLQCENSGTTMRLMAGALAGRSFRSTLVGDPSLSRRPMGRLVGPLQALGATVDLAEDGTPPLSVGTDGPLHAAHIQIPMASAQVRSAFILAALQADAPSSVKSPAGFRDHTERWLEALGRGQRVSPTEFVVDPGPIPAGKYSVPGDPSSAAFLWTAAAIRPGIEAEVTDSVGGDPVGEVTVRGRPLHATEVSGDLAVAALDELPLVAVLGAMAEGITVVKDAGELKVKESDRIASTVGMIEALGGGAEATEDGFAVVGTGWMESGVVEAAGDHRIAMAGAVAAGGARGTVTVSGARAAGVSWPGFYEELESVWSSR
jgi:3-phosphoshikimate 1-carboxyvinyltransferase